VQAAQVAELGKELAGANEKNVKQKMKLIEAKELNAKLENELLVMAAEIVQYKEAAQSVQARLLFLAQDQACWSVSNASAPPHCVDSINKK